MREKAKTNSKLGKEELILLFQEYQQDIYRMAFTYVKNSEDALDIVQDVAYKCLKNIDTLKEKKYFKTWLLKITINCSLDLLRRSNKIVAIESTDLEKHQDILNTKVDVPLMLSLNDILEKLNETEKTVILLKYFQEYTFQEISLFMSLPLSTVKTITYRALGKLKQYIKKEDIYGA
ncbi:RNA polymerase [Heyndrickxia camelliae]|uniref:RNA polymerase n=1 Tax=Heyndrickxia camelliae TaxID=1707093 RepID=A0A2N3LM45_9BACI|nr:sigma-70 family RNA polymerase sigma factor [Heyndrickxia camelliae]PKR85635.1 RNA polymerase [Heyndrickxia camelliae]